MTKMSEGKESDNIGQFANNIDEQLFAKHLHEIHRLFVQFLNPRLKGFYGGLNDYFFDLAESAQNNHQQNQYFAAIGDTRKSNTELNRQFAKNINIIFQKFKNHQHVYFIEGSQQTEHDKKNLTLIKEDDLDQKLAINNVTGKISQIYHEELFLLNRRLAELAGVDDINNQTNPIGPDALVNAFALSLRALKSDNNIKLIIIKLFEKNMVEGLGPVYKLVNKYLKKQGVLPEIKFEIKQQVSRVNQVNNSINYLAKALSETDENYQKIANILHQDDDQLKAQGSDTSEQYTSQKLIEFSQLSSALDQIRTELLSDQELAVKQSISPLELKDELLKKLKSLKALTGQTQINKADERTIDLIGELFQFLVEDRNLPESIQLVLSKLQLPYLQIALRDETFFSDKKNNARQLLNLMAKASIGWTPETDEKSVFLTQIKEIVGFILNNHEKNINYEKLIARFIQFERKIHKKVMIAEKMHSAKMSGRERLNWAKVEAAKVLKNNLKGQKLPATIRTLLLKPWGNVLVLSFLREQESPKLLEKYKDFVSKMIQVANPDGDKKSSQLDIDQLLIVMQEGLQLVALQAQELDAKTKEISSILLQINGLNKAKLNLAYIDPAEILNLSKEFNKQSDVAKFMKTGNNPNVAPVKQAVINDQHQQAAEDLKVDDWIEMYTEDRVLRIKVSWISPISGKLLFVNSKGGREMDIFRVELAEKFRNHECRTMQQMPLIDRAMQSIVNKLAATTDTTSVIQ